MCKFEALLLSESWQEVYELEQTVDVRFQNFFHIFKYYFDISFSVKCKTIISNAKSRKPWLTQGLIISGHKLKDLYQLTLTGDSHAIQYYKSYKKLYRKLGQENV